MILFLLVCLLKIMLVIVTISLMKFVITHMMKLFYTPPCTSYVGIASAMEYVG